MDREGFRNRMKQYKKAREENPGLKYWEWKDIPKYDEGTENVEEWNPRITAEGVDDEGYYVQAMNPLPEVTVVGSKARSRSERPILLTYVKGLPGTTTWATDYNPGAGSLEIVSPEFDILTGVRAIATLPTKAEKLGRILLNSDIVTPQIRIQPNDIVYRSPIKEKVKTISYGKAKTLANDLITGSPYENIMGKIVSVDRGPWKSKIGVTGDQFGKYIGNGSESTVFMANDDPNFVYKILTTNVSTPLDAKDYLSMIYSNRNKVPVALQHKLVGFVKNDKGFNPVMRLKRVRVLDQKDNKTLLEKVLPLIDKKMNRSGYNRYADTHYFNDKNNVDILDIKPENVGQLENGNYTLLDFIYLLHAEQIPIKSIASDIFSKWNKSYAEGGEVGENNFMKQFGKQVSYKPEETSWWSDVKNWWNDLTGMKNYAYGNCATTPGGKHTKECAHYSNSILRNQGYKNIVGDAWTRAANSGMKKITSGYDGLTKPIEWNENDAHEYLQSAAENFASKIDTTGLKPYDVIGLYYPDSPNTKKAFEQGRWGETQTHTGHTVIGKDGTHYVVHNVDGHLKINKLADMLTGDYEYKPVSAYRPKKYAEGGQVEPDPLEVLERSRPKVAGIPINDKPLSGTDPIGEAMMWGLGGGAASAALRSLFPTYGATAAWLAFGSNNKDNMLVIPNNPTKNTTPIETGLLNKEVRQYYADDVLPRDILTSEVDKLKFLNTDKNFEYDLYPQGYFANGVVGHYDRMNDVIRLNGGYVTDKDLLDNVMSHEVNHRYNREFPLDKEHTRILNRAYTVEPKLNTAAARAARKESEKRATNVNIRHKLQTDLRNTLGRKPTKTEMDEFIDSLSDLELLDRLGSASSYGSAYLMSIKERSDLVNQPADQYKKARTTGLRKALKYVAMNENKNDNNQNYA